MDILYFHDDYTRQKHLNRDLVRRVYKSNALNWLIGLQWEKRPTCHALNNCI